MNDLSRRQLFQALVAAGVGSEVFQRAVAAQADTAVAVTPQLVERAEWVAGLQLTEEDRKTVAGILNGWHAAFRKLREVPLDNGVHPALAFHPAPFLAPDGGKGSVE